LALITGGAVGGLCQGIFAVLVFNRGYIFSDIAMITAPLFLATLAVHLTAGIVIGTFVAPWAPPRVGSPTMHDGAPLHHEAHVLERADIAEGVAGYCDQVGELAGLDRANPVGHAEQLGGVGGGHA
jgi:hypothetical protein